MMSRVFLRIAFRNVRRNPRRTAFAVLAISFSLFCLIVFLAMKAGLHREMVLNTVKLDAGTLQVHASGHEVNLASMKPIPDRGHVIDVLKKAGVDKFALRLKVPALLLAGKGSSTVLLSGIDPVAEKSVTFISTRMVKGNYLSGGKGIVIGEELAESLKADTGKEITLMFQSSAGIPSMKKFIVSGIYRTALASFNRSHVYVTLADAQAFLNAEGVVTEIAALTDVEKSAQSAEALNALLSSNEYQVRTWEEIAPDVRQLIDLNNATMNLLIIIVFAIVAMGITNTMTTVTFERFRELGAMAAIGTAPSGIISMIIFESSFLGAIAAVAGSLAGAGACFYLGKYGIDLTSLTSTNQYFASSHILRAYLTAGDFVMANVLTLVTSAASGIYPAWKASRLDPVRAILYT